MSSPVDERTRHDRRWVVAAVIAAGLWAGSSPVAAADDLDPAHPTPYWRDARKACGPQCLAFLCHYFGQTRTYSDVASLCPPGPDGTSLAQLSAAAESCGLSTLGFRGDALELRFLEHPAIVQVRSSNPDGGDHFMVHLGWNQTGESVRVYDPPRMLQEIPFRRLQDAFLGNGLLVSNTRIQWDGPTDASSGRLD